MHKLLYATFTAFLAGSALVSVTASRVSNQPLLSPGETWSSFGLFNPAAIEASGKTVLLFRAQDRDHTSRIGYAESADGLHFTERPDPVLSPRTPYEQGGGVEDPRVLRINGTYYLTYTGYNRQAHRAVGGRRARSISDAQLCLATSTDLIHWNRKGVILPAYKGTWNTQWTKSGAIVGEKIDGKWWMYYLGTRKDSDGVSRDYMGLASSDDLLHWSDATSEPVLPRHPGAFDSRVMEPGPPPFLTQQGILLLYNGADDHLVYRPGWVLFDRRDPRRILSRCDKPFAAPTLAWEKIGNVPNVIFLEGAVAKGNLRGDSLDLMGYYGAADKYIGALDVRVNLTK